MRTKVTYVPTELVFRNRWPFTAAASTGRAVPTTATRRASPTSVGMPRSWARWLSLPPGITPSSSDHRDARLAASAMVPSPPATATRLTPDLARCSIAPGSSPVETSRASTGSPLVRTPSTTSRALCAEGLTRRWTRVSLTAVSETRTGTRRQPGPRFSSGTPCGQAAFQNPASALPSGDSRSFSNARSRICRMRSRVTPMSAPMRSSVMASDPSSRP